MLLTILSILGGIAIGIGLGRLSAWGWKFKSALFRRKKLARKAIFEHIDNGVIVVDLKGKLVDANPVALRLLQLEPEALNHSFPTADLAPWLNLAPDSNAIFRDEVWIRDHRVAYSRIPIAEQGSPPEGWVVTLRDFTKEYHLGLELKERLEIDPLTRLKNRRAIHEHASIELERFRRHGHKVSFLVIDIDHFKKVNDTFGHLAGDLVLRHISIVLKSALRREDYIGRWGGEEFLAILPDTNSEAAWAAAGRLRLAVEQTAAQLENRSIRCTISIGIATAKDPSTPIEILFARADDALYVAKANGRNRAVQAD